MQEHSSVGILFSCGLHLLKKGAGYTSEMQTWHTLDSCNVHLDLKDLGNLSTPVLLQTHPEWICLCYPQWFLPKPSVETQFRNIACL